MSMIFIIITLKDNILPQDTLKLTSSFLNFKSKLKLHVAQIVFLMENPGLDNIVCSHFLTDRHASSHFYTITNNASLCLLGHTCKQQNSPTGHVP
jgi:hypothetical protein